MKIRNGHIALLGIASQLIVGFLLLIGGRKLGGWGGFALILEGSVLRVALLMGVLPAVLLYYERTRMLGAIISIVLGILGMAFSVGSLLEYSWL